MKQEIISPKKMMNAHGTPKGGFTQNPVTAYDPAYGQRQSSHMQQEHHHRQHRQSGLLKTILKQF